MNPKDYREALEEYSALKAAEAKKVEDLQHWGIKGMKWGVRRWQNDDGSLTPAGEKRYLKYQGYLDKKAEEGTPKFKERVMENIKNSAERGYELGWKVNDDTEIFAVAGTLLGSLIGTTTAVPLSVLQSKLDKYKLKKAEAFVEKYKNTALKDL